MLFIIENCILQENFVIFTNKETNNRTLFKPDYSKSILFSTGKIQCKCCMKCRSDSSYNMKGCSKQYKDMDIQW